MYKYEVYEDLLKTIMKQYNIQPHRIHKYIHELYFAVDAPFARLIYDPEKSRILISYHTQASQIDCIVFFLKIQKIIPNLILTESFYIDMHDQMHVGKDAETMVFLEFEDYIVRQICEQIPDKEVDIYFEYKDQHRATFTDLNKEAAADFFIKMRNSKTDTKH